MLERDRNMPARAELGRPLLLTWCRRAATGVAALLVVLMGYGVFFGHNGITSFEGKRAEEGRLREQMQQLERENARLRGHVDRLQNDPGAIEHQAREELHYTRPGEVIYTLESPDSAPAIDRSR